MTKVQTWEELAEILTQRGWRVLDKPHPNQNGPDMIVVDDKTAYRIEIKVARLKDTGSWAVSPVEEPSKLCDFVAINIGNSWIFRTMREHLIQCSQSGYATVTELAALLREVS